MKIKIYGSRGSVGFFSRDNLKYGGNTVCTVVDIDGHIIVLDCGTGLMQFYYDHQAKLQAGCKFDILLSHLHLDHIIGFSTFPPILADTCDIRIFTRSRNELPLKEQVFGIFKPPYWPIDMAALTKAQIIEIAAKTPFQLNEELMVTPFWSEHHNETVAFRLEKSGKTLVYLLDYEVGNNPEKYDDLLNFCSQADLVIFDATYVQEDYPARRGWGHSTFDDGIALAAACSCRQMIFSHMCQDYSDRRLDARAQELDNSRFVIAYDGLETEI